MAKNKVLIKKKYQNCFFWKTRFFLKSSYFFGYNIEKKGGIQVFLLGNLNFSFLSAGR